MTEYVRVVVVGGGCVGVSVLYGLAKRGWTDCMLLEKGRLTGGSTFKAAGLLPSYARSKTVSQVINKSIEIYSGLEEETGQAVGLHKCGQLRIARKPLRMDEYRSYMDIAEAIGASAQLLSPEQVLELWPLIKSGKNILGGLYHPNEGHISPSDVTMAMAHGARSKGAKIREGVHVEGFKRLASGEWEVQTSAGVIQCEHIVLATGLHARAMGRKFGLDIPAVPLIVQYWITQPIEEIVARKHGNRPELPIVRDEAFLGYTREEGDGLMFGTYERPEDLEMFGIDGVPDWYHDEIMPANFEAHARGFEIACDLIPALARAGIRSNTRGAMQMTPDGLPLVGPAWGVENVWMAEGVPGGILWGGGIGHMLSSWIIEGRTDCDMMELDARRFSAHANREWTCQRVIDVWGAHSDVFVPFEETEAARPAKTAPVHDRLHDLGAVFGANNGWEMPLWYAPKGVPQVDDVSYRRSRHGAFVGQEVEAIRNRVGLVEMTPMAKYEVSGPGAAAYMDRFFAGRLPAVGRCCQALHLYPNGGVRTNCTVARLADDLFYLIAVPRVERLNFDELWKALPRDGSVILRNTTMERAIFTVAGPRAREVLKDVVDSDFSNDACPWLSVGTANAGLCQDVRMLRISCTGELAWELHHPMAYQRQLLERILKSGAKESIKLVGTRALGSMRLDKSYREIGMDINHEITALEAGLQRFVSFDKDFVGRAALDAQKSSGLTQKLVTVRVATTDASVIQHESVYKDRRLAGRLTSGGWSWHLNTDLALALLTVEHCEIGTELEVSILGERVPAIVIPDSPYDSANERCRM